MSDRAADVFGSAERQRDASEGPAGHEAVYPISVAAELVGSGVQNLRAYEKAGLVRPGRTSGGTRLYSADDLTRIRRVLVLLDAGLNLVGIAMVLDLQDDNARLRGENDRQHDRAALRRSRDA